MALHPRDKIGIVVALKIEGIIDFKERNLDSVGSTRPYQRCPSVPE
jgi:hypothetical protein